MLAREISRDHVFTRPCVKRAAIARRSRPTLVRPISMHMPGTIGHLLFAPSSNPVCESPRRSFARAACGTLVRFEIVSYACEHGNYVRIFTFFSDTSQTGHSCFYRDNFAWLKLSVRSLRHNRRLTNHPDMYIARIVIKFVLYIFSVDLNLIFSS